MADATAKKLLELLGPDHPVDLRQATARVLAELGLREPAAVKALIGGLADENEAVRIEVMGAVGKLRIDAALPQLIKSAEGGGAEGEAAARAAASLGAKATKALRELMDHVPPGLKRRIASALASGEHASAETAAVDALLDHDPGVVDASVRSLIGRVPGLSASHRRSLLEHSLELLKNARKHKLAPHSEAALVRLLAALKDPRGEDIFWERIEGPQPTDLRIAALQALGTLATPTRADRIKRLLACANDNDFRVAAPALLILKEAKVAPKSASDWLPLLRAVDPGVRRFAIEKIGAIDSAEVAAALAQQISFRDKGVRELALTHLGQSKHGPQTLVSALLEADSVDKAWDLARAQADHVAAYPKPLREKLFKQAFDYIDKEDRRADALLFALRQADARGVRDKIEERALALRKKKQYDKAMIYLRLLTRDPGCTDPIRFEQAACALKLSAKDVAPEARNSDPCLHQFAGLLHRHETEPYAFIDKARWLEPEDLFYLGFHFAEATGPPRDFGAKVLKLLIKRSPKGKVAKDARAKLRSQGLDKA
ncbi:MAG: HEAT repeat domain-containing protein [Gemmataceae bacterium]